MKTLIVICKTFDVVIVPFPFVDTVGSKLRPALVLSTEQSNEAGYIVLAMITSAKHSKKMHDITINHLGSTGLTVSSIIRMKLFSLDSYIIYKKIGILDKNDQKIFKKAFKALFMDICRQSD